MEDLSLLSGEVLVNNNSNSDAQCISRFGTLTPSEEHCNAFWDGVLCWPPTPYNTLAVLKCFEELNGIKYDSTKNATRLCGETEWRNYSDYSGCEIRDSNSTMTSAADITSLLYLTGYSISLAALSLAVFVFLYFKDLRCLRNTIHTNLMCTYMLSGCTWILNLVLQLFGNFFWVIYFYLPFFVGIILEYTDFLKELTFRHSKALVSDQGDQVSCMVLVICLHYFSLTNFFWMLVEGLYLYMLVVETFTAENIKLKVYASIGWGTPAVFIIIWVITRSLVAVDNSDTDVISGAISNAVSSKHPLCPWVKEHPIADWIHIVPAMTGLALNLFFLLRIMWVLIIKLRSANTIETEQYRKATKALLVLIPLFGITYIVVLKGPSEGWSGVMFRSIQAILLSTQGFTVAVFYCFLNTEVQHAIRHRAEQWKIRRAVGSSRRRGASYSKDWSPRSRTESIRLFDYLKPSNRDQP